MTSKEGSIFSYTTFLALRMNLRMTTMMLQGVCTVRSLRNISNVEQQIKEPVVANNATASTVAFIAPGPPNPPITQV